MTSQKFTVDLGEYVGVYVFCTNMKIYYEMLIGRKDGSPLKLKQHDFHGGFMFKHPHDGLTMSGCFTTEPGDAIFSPREESMAIYPGGGKDVRYILWGVAEVEAYLRKLAARDTELRMEKMKITSEI